MMDDELVRRRIAAVQLGLLAALLIMLVGPETVELSRSFATQLALLTTGIAAALAVERGTRPVSRQHGTAGRTAAISVGPGPRRPPVTG